MQPTMSTPTFQSINANQNQQQYQSPPQPTAPAPAPNSGQQRSPARIAKSPVASSSTTSQHRFSEKLRTLPVVRPIPWRSGQELPPEKSSDSPRVQQRGAVLLATRGQIADPPCTHCAGGYGRFSECIALGNWFQGACSGCVFTSKGNKCSLRHEVSGNADGRSLRYHDDPEVLESIIRDAAENPKPIKKRKKRPTESLVDYSDTSAQAYSPLPRSPDLDALLQAEILEQEESVNVPKIKKRQRTSYAAASSSPAYATAEENYHNAPINVIVAANASKQRASFGTQSAREPAELATPSQGHANALQGPTTPIIDTFPKAKQKQIYGFISGVSSGIKNLQRELDSLKAVLGIDQDDHMESH